MITTLRGTNAKLNKKNDILCEREPNSCLLKHKQTNKILIFDIFLSFNLFNDVDKK